MKRHTKREVATQTAIYYIISFLIVAFSVSASFFLFLRGFALPDLPTIKAAAIRTFLNALFISAIFTTIHFVWRHFAVTIPTDRILASLNEITAGNFDSEVKINKIFGKYADIAEKLNCTAQELKSVETLKTDFISNVSHELKTPLANIKSYSELLRISDSDCDKTEYTDAIIRNVNIMSKLITDILRLNKLENNVIHANNDTFDVGTAVTACLLSFESAWEEKNILLETDIPENIFVTSDKEMLELIWNNLLSNAFKFTPENGTVSVTVGKDESNNTTVEVSDNGIGMSDETKRHVFDKFYQADSSHSTKGNGLGLALAKRAAAVANCTISVESEEGKGSRFKVTIP